MCGVSLAASSPIRWRCCCGRRRAGRAGRDRRGGSRDRRRHRRQRPVRVRPGACRPSGPSRRCRPTCRSTRPCCVTAAAVRSRPRSSCPAMCCSSRRATGSPPTPGCSRVDRARHVGAHRRVAPGVRAPRSSTDVDVPLLQATGSGVQRHDVHRRRGRALVFATGMRTELGRIAALSERVEPEESPLEHQVRRVAWLIAAVAVVLAAAFLPLATLARGPAVPGRRRCSRSGSSSATCRRACCR